jgi:hypothetical protein
MRRIIIACALAGVLGVPAKADETLKAGTIYYTTSVQSQPAPDADGHVLSLVASSGLASLPDGSVATESVVATTDYVKGSRSFITYGTLTFRDGSALFFKSNATGTTDGTKTSLKGTTIILGGKGRYEGAKGEGTFTGETVQPGPDAIQYIDNVINVRK